MAKNKFNKAWMHEHIHDHYVKSAANEGYRSRAAYKLLEIDKKYSLLNQAQHVVDLGCAPGSWAQVITRRLGPQAVAIGVDLLEIEPIHGLQFIQGDFTDKLVLEQVINILNGHLVDLIVSDMAPNLSGIKNVDQARAAYLVELVIDFAANHLDINGKCLIKVFQGSEFASLTKQMRGLFKQVITYKPDASRAQSSEVYLIGLGKQSL